MNIHVCKVDRNIIAVICITSSIINVSIIVTTTTAAAAAVTSYWMNIVDYTILRCIGSHSSDVNISLLNYFYFIVSWTTAYWHTTNRTTHSLRVTNAIAINFHTITCITIVAVFSNTSIAVKIIDSIIVVVVC